MQDQRREKHIQDADSHAYWRFTGPARLDKDLHTLEGLLRGVAADGRIEAAELDAVRQWTREHAEHARRHPFNEIMPLLDNVLADGVVDQEEAQDVLWLCERLSTENDYFAAVTSDIQRLQGMLAGMAADLTISHDELTALRGWLEEHDDLKGCWPFDEIDAILTAVMSDGVIDAEDHRMLVAFCSEFAESGRHRAVDLPLNDLVKPREGICAACPEIAFPGKLFCFTGESIRAKRSELATIVERLGGELIPSMRQGLNYLVIGAGGNRAWAFACYGRKVEQAMNWRKQGHPVVLVHENDFWDAVADAGG